MTLYEVVEILQFAKRRHREKRLYDASSIWEGMIARDLKWRGLRPEDFLAMKR